MARGQRADHRDLQLINRGSRRGLAALHGAALSAWCAAWGVATVLGAERAWGLIPLDPAQGKSFFPFELIAQGFTRRIGLPFLDSLASMSVALIVAGAVLGYLCAGAGQAMRLDTERLALRALLDIAGRWRTVLLWLAPFVLSLAFFAVGGSGHEWAIAAGTVCSVGAWLVSPFLVFNRRVLGEQSRPLYFTAPGLRAFLAALLLTLCGWMVAAAGSGVDALAGAAAGFATDVLTTPIAAVLTVLTCAAWIDGIDWRSLRERRAVLLNWRVIGAFIAQDIRLGVLALWIAIPVLCIAVTKIYVLPQIMELVERQGGISPGPISHVLWLASAYWWLIVPGLVPPMLAWTGRLYVLLFPTSAGGGSAPGRESPASA